MSIIDHLTPVYYRVQRMGIQRSDTGPVAVYDVQILNAAGQVLATINPTATLTSQERAAVVAIFTRDQATWESSTGLTKWVEPEG